MPKHLESHFIQTMAIGVIEAEKILFPWRQSQGSIFTMFSRFSGRFIHRKLWGRKFADF